jgi:hypothetical protein
LRRYTANLQLVQVVEGRGLMDFNTGGSGGRPDDESRPLYGGEAGGRPPGEPPRGPVGGTAGEFNLQDPVGSFISTVRRVVLDPVGFFRAIPRQGDFINPAVYALIIALITALLSGILTLILSPLIATPGNTGEALAGGVVGFVVTLILTPIFTAITLLIGAGIFHLLVLLLVRPNNAGFEATFRVVCYSYTPNILSFLAPIPILGQIVSLAVGIYSIVLAIFGIREVHNTTTGKAALVVLIPVAVLFLFVLLIFGAALLFLFSGSSQQQF